MRAMILAAGFGTRLRPLTKHLPKPLIPILGRPLIFHLFDFLANAGITEIVINTHHLSEVLAQAIKEKEMGNKIPLSVKLVFEPVILGSGGGIGNVRKFFHQHGIFVVMNGDILVDFDLKAAISFHRAHKGIATMVLRPDPEVKRFGAIGIDKEGKVRQFVGKLPPCKEPLEEFMFTGVHIFEEAIFDFIQPDEVACINHDIYPRIFAAGLPVFGFVSNGFWADVGTPERYLAANLFLLRSPVGVYRKNWDQGIVEQEGILSTGTALVPPVWIGKEVELGKGGKIGPEVVMDDHATIGSNVFIQHSVVWPKSQIPADALLDRAIVTPFTTLSCG